jgi:hypothetical protein
MNRNRGADEGQHRRATIGVDYIGNSGDDQHGLAPLRLKEFRRVAPQ